MYVHTVYFTSHKQHSVLDQKERSVNTVKSDDRCLSYLTIYVDNLQNNEC